MVETKKSVELNLYAPEAHRVSLVGDFNNWNKENLPANKSARGIWKIKVNLKPGRYEYKFLVDSNWWNDPKAETQSSNPFGSQNSVITIK